MSQSSHAVVWLDHSEAHILHFTSEDVLNKFAGKPRQRRHHKRGGGDSMRGAEDQAYFDTIAKSLTDAKEVLVAGPATAKTAFVKHLNEHGHPLRARIIAVETVNHHSDGELLDYARKHFRD